MGFIYGLIDPETLFIRYIGLATNARRPSRHRDCLKTHEKSHKRHWLAELATRDITYSVVQLDQCLDRTALQDLERWWIAYGRALGWPLTNMTDGGDGFLNPTPEARAKISATHKGKKLTPDHIAKLTKAAKRPKSTETIEKIKKALTGRKAPPDQVEKNRQAKLAKPGLRKGRTKTSQAAWHAERREKLRAEIIAELRNAR